MSKFYLSKTLPATSSILNNMNVTNNINSNISTLAQLLPPGEEIFDIYEIVNLNFPIYSFLSLIFFIILVSVLLYAFVKFIINTYKNIVINSQKIHIEISSVDPTIEAIQALKNLKNSNYWDNNKLKDLAEQLAIIIKRFLRFKYNIGVGEASTSDEIIHDLKINNVSSNLLYEISEVFDSLDSIKYRGVIPNIDLESFYKKIYNIINSNAWNRVEFKNQVNKNKDIYLL